MATYAYLRVSTEGQSDSGAGMSAQLDACQRIGGNLAGIYKDEGISGSASIDKRLGLLEAISVLSKGDILIVAKRDRLGRDPLVIAMVEKEVRRKGARIISAAGEGTDSDNPSDILMRRMVDAFSEYERLLIKTRTKSALQAKKVRGERVGTVAFGWNVDIDGKTLVRNESEQKIIEAIKEYKSAGLSLREIVSRLKSLGHVSRSGKPLGLTQVARVVNG